MSTPVDRRAHVVVLLCALFVLTLPAAGTQRAQDSADARLRALYTEEWKWRQQEVARSDQYAAAGMSDRFPRVDAASQQARSAYWTKTLAALDAIPFDQLSPEEKVNAQVFRTSVRALADDVKYRTYEAPDDARGGRAAGRRRLLSGDDRKVHHAEPDGQTDS
jgi:uncharacterized protein (DUF885 family)